MILYLVEYNGLPDFVKLSRMEFFVRGKNAKLMNERYSQLSPPTLHPKRPVFLIILSKVK